MKASGKMWIGRAAIAILLLALLTDVFLGRTGLGIGVLSGSTHGGFLGGSLAFVFLWCALAGLAPVLLPNLVFQWTRGLPAAIRLLLSMMTLGMILGYMYFLYSQTGIGTHTH